MPLEIVVKPNPELRDLVRRMENAGHPDVDVIRRLEARVERQVETIQAEHQTALELEQKLGEAQAKLDRWSTDLVSNRKAAMELAINSRKAAEAARDGAQEERDRWRGKFHGMATQRDDLQKRLEAHENGGSWEGSFARLKKEIHHRAKSLGIPTDGTCRIIIGRMAQCALAACDNVKAAEQGRDYWRKTHGEQERYFLSGIKDDAQRAGIDAGGTVGMATVHMMAEEIQKCHQVRSTYWSGVQEAIRDMEKGVSYHAVCHALRSLQDSASKAYGAPPPPDQAAELQVRCDLLETGIRDAQTRLDPCSKEAIGPKVQGGRDILRNALERTGLDGCEPQKPSELKAKLTEAMRLLRKDCYSEAEEELQDALAMADFLYHQNDPPMTDLAYQALEKVRDLLGAYRGYQGVGEAQDTLRLAMELLIEEPSQKMMRGALKQAQDLLASAERLWCAPTKSIRELTETLTHVRAHTREAKIMLDTVLGDD